MFKILAIETATAACSAALQVDGEIFKRQQLAPQKHAELILPMINSLLNEAGISLQQLNAIAFGCGPGSFMGVRVATGIAQGLGFGANLPLIPLSTLQILAQVAYERAGVETVVAAWDARMNEMYWGIYQLGENKMMLPVQEDRLNPPEEVHLSKQLAFVAVGNAWQAYQNRLKHLLTADLPVITDLYPEAEVMLKMGENYYQAGKWIDPLQARPVYLRDRVTSDK